MGEKHNVRLEPVGIDFEVDEDETVLHAAFRQGLQLMHGCKEGQCSSCKSFLLDGEVDLDRYSTFALPDFEEQEGWTLLCRAHALTDLEVELINYDEDMLKAGLPLVEAKARVTAVEELTHDIRRLELELIEPAELEFHPGQYVDISIPGEDGNHRSFSMANLPSDKGQLEFMIKLYPDGRFSGLLGSGEICAGTELDITGPYGVFTLRDQSPRRIVFIGGGAGMAPILCLLRSLQERGIERDAVYYYGARTETDLFHRDELEALASELPSFRYVPALSDAEWDGEAGMITDVVERLEAGPQGRRRLRVRSAAHGRGRPGPADGQGRPRVTHLFRQVHDHRDGGDEPHMSTETPAKERSVPKPVFTDAEAGSQEFPSSTSRSYNYFTPAKRRATIYEDVTVDVQPDPERHLTQGWIYGFADGTSGYPQEWSALKSSNWHEFLDPNEEWEQTIYRNNANVVRQAQSNIANAKDAHAFAQWNRRWTDVVAKHVGAWAHAEHGLGMHVYVPANRDAPTNMINNALSVGAVHKLRFAQDLILYNLDLDDEIEGFDGQAHITTWQEDPIWQKTRENVEQADGDARLVGGVLRHRGRVRAAGRRAVPQQLRDAGRRAAGRLRHPDRCSARPSRTPRASSAARAGCSGCSPTTPSTARRTSRRCRAGWTEWTPVSIEAARTLQPIWSQPAEKAITFEDSMERSQHRFEDLLSDIGLDTPKEA